MLKLRIFDAYEKILYYGIGPLFRKLGHGFYLTGREISKDIGSEDRLVPSLRRRKINGALPNLNNADFIAPDATILGKVEVSDNSSIWYGSILRGDLNEIKIGKNSVLQDRVTVYPQSGEGKGIKIGDNVIIGPNSVIESSTLENNSFIGMGASVRKGAKIQSFGLVAAGAVVPEDTIIPSYQIWAGNPAHYLRDLTNEEKEVLDEHHQEIQQLAKVHSEETEKTMRQVIDQMDYEEQLHEMTIEDVAVKQLEEIGFPIDYEDTDYIEQRIHNLQPTVKEERWWEKRYDPYEQDLFNFPDSFKSDRENFKKYEEVQKFFEENPYAAGKTVERKERVEPVNKEAWTRKY